MKPSTVSSPGWMRTAIAVHYGRNVSYQEAEWEFYVQKLHGKYLSATKEDLEQLKALANKF